MLFSIFLALHTIPNLSFCSTAKHLLKMRGQGLVVLFWVLGGLATVVIALRVFAKVRIGPLRMDDIVMLFAWVGGLLPWDLLQF